MHADVIACRQSNQTSIEKIKNFMNKYENPPCNSSLATSFIIKKMSTAEEEVGIISPFGGSVASDERELAIVRVFLRAVQSPICISSPMTTWLSRR